jgi:hypothetical protein
LYDQHIRMNFYISKPTTAATAEKVAAAMV